LRASGVALGIGAQEREALADFLALEEKRHRLTLEGLAAIDAGRLIDHSDVLAGPRA